MSRKILVVYPYNFFQNVMGTNVRVKGLVDCFCELGYTIDLFAFTNAGNLSDFQDFKNENRDGQINNLYLFNFNSFWHKLRRRFLHGLKILTLRESCFGNWIQPESQALFDKIVFENKYDIIIFFYPQMASLLYNKTIKSKKIIFIEDSFFLQQSYLKNKKFLTSGKILDEELECLKVFDELFCISYDEKNLYNRLLGKEVHFIPHLIGNTSEKTTALRGRREWDICFIGSDNPFNTEGLKWFFESVFPLLDSEFSIIIVGAVTRVVDIPKRENIKIIPFAENLDDIYNNAKVCICPMFHGTGMKIKVVEAMSRGLPVVCNERGVDGLPDKFMSGCLVTQDGKEFAAYITDLLSDEEYYMMVSKKIKEYYEKIFNRESVLNTIKEIFER